MKQFQLLYSYEEWLDFNEGKDKDCPCLKRISEDMARSLTLSAKFERTEEEKRELERLKKSNEEGMGNSVFTDLTHQITDLCLNPKSDEIDFEQIGRLQYRIERMKYPVVVPKKNE